jgi:hypothetical protein
MKKPQSLEIAVKKLSSLGSLDGIDFLFFGLHRGLDMGGHIAGAVFPFQGRIRCSRAVHAGGIIRHSLAPHAFLHDRQAVAFIVAAAGGCHEYTVFPFPHSFTDHDTHFLKNSFGFNFSKLEKPLCFKLGTMFPDCCFPMDSRSWDGKPVFYIIKTAQLSIKDRWLFINSNRVIFFMGKNSGLVYKPGEQNN